VSSEATKQAESSSSQGWKTAKTSKADSDLLGVDEVLVRSCLSPPPLQVKGKAYKESTNIKHPPTLK
jgi:hypothetical protein